MRTSVTRLSKDEASIVLAAFHMNDTGYDNQCKRLTELRRDGVIDGYTCGGGGAISCQVRLSCDCTVWSKDGKEHCCLDPSMNIAIASALAAATGFVINPPAES